VPEIVRDRLTSILGAYLTGCVAYQIALHFWPGGAPPMIAPRFGMAYLLTVSLRVPDSFIPTVDFALCFWELVVAISCF
jgi:hypothetical protein